MDKREEILNKKFKEAGINKGWLEESKKAVLEAMQEYFDNKDENLIRKINSYNNLHTEILKSFGVEGDWYQIESQVSERWYSPEHYPEISYLDSSGVEYGYDCAHKMGESEGYVLFFVQDNGDKFYAIFNKSMEYKDYDEFEEEFGVEI